MTPDTIAEHEVDTFVRALAKDPELRCEFNRRHVRCPNSARWGVRCAKCGTDVHACDRCRILTDHAQHMGYTIECRGVKRGGCGQVYPSPLPWRPV
jgi:hypothetical protein